MKPSTVAPTTISPCGGLACKAFVGEVCQNKRCVCQEGKARRDPNDPCTAYDRLIYIPIIVTTDGGKPLLYNPNQNNEDTREFKELIPPYIKQVGTIYQNILSTL